MSFLYYSFEQELVNRVGRLETAEQRVCVLEREVKEQEARYSSGLASQLAGRMSSIEDILRGLLGNQAAVLEHVRLGHAPQAVALPPAQSAAALHPPTTVMDFAAIQRTLIQMSMLNHNTNIQ